MENPIVRLLDRLPSLKARLSVIIVAAVGTSVGLVSIGRGLGVPWLVAAVVGTALALLLVRFAARGTTSRLRDLTAAAERLAGGDHDHRVAVTTRDEVGQLSASFNAMAAEIATADRLRRDFVANASHELRTPITAARVVLENMVDGVQPCDTSTLRPVLGQVERLGRLVDQLFDLTTLESGTAHLVRVPVDLRMIVDDVLESVAMRVGPGKVTADDGPGHDHDSGEDVVVAGDSDRLRQVVSNLVDNALRHARFTTPIVVSLRAASDVVWLRVTDDGPGIAPQERERVFERFVRGDDARASRDGGAGLGLSIVRSIVDAHHGTVRIEENANSPGRSSSSLPLSSSSTPVGCTIVIGLPR